MDFTHAVLVAGLIALGVSQAVSFAIQARTLQHIHEVGNKTLTTAEATLEAALAMLKRLKA
jgi:hypothetical protein